MSTTLDFTLRFGSPGYIANPYWPEMYRVIEIQKVSGVNRAKSEQNRRKALEEHLRSISMTLAGYEELLRLSARPFHLNGDGLIVIPSDNILACLVNAVDVAPSKLRIQNTRVAIRATDFLTTKRAPDGVWERFAVVTSGTGKKASNQRGFRSSSYIKDFDAKGSLTIDPEMVSPKAVRDLLEFAGRVGIGASRKMGWGRFGVQ